MPMKILKNKEGFTLLEVLVAGAILSVGLLAIANMMITAINANSFARKMGTAQLLAEQRIEKYRNLNVFGVTPFTSGNIEADSEYCVGLAQSGIEDYGTIKTVGSACTTPDSRYTAFRRETVASIINANMVSVTVTVKWKDSAQNVHSVPLNTILTQ